LQGLDVKKLFVEIQKINKRLDELPSNGDVEKLTEAAKKLVANTAGFENVVIDHGATLGRMLRVIERLERRCPLMKPETDEFESVSAKLKVCDEEG
jgi:hypothetical protein